MTDDIRDDPLLKDVPEIDGFKVLDSSVLYVRLGAGGMGAVYRGRHLKLDIDVAVKCLLPYLADANEELVLRFEREGKLAARLNHPNIVRVYDVDSLHGVHYLVMEYVKGETARERVERKGGGLPPGESATIVLEAARGLAAAHKEGIVHRDIKPDNILISKKGEVKLADLGLGRLREEAGGREGLTMSGLTMGTPRYMPPEQWDGLQKVGPPGDVWALGATFYFLLAGEDAYGGSEKTQIMRRVCTEPFPDIGARIESVPPELTAMIARCTEIEPAKRYPTAQAVVEALERAVGKLGLKSSLHDEGTGTGTSRCKLVSPPPPELLLKARLQMKSSTAPRRPDWSSAVTASGPMAVAQPGSRSGLKAIAVAAGVLLAAAGAGGGAYLAFLGGFPGGRSEAQGAVKTPAVPAAIAMAEPTRLEPRSEPRPERQPEPQPRLQAKPRAVAPSDAEPAADPAADTDAVPDAVADAALDAVPVPRRQPPAAPAPAPLPPAIPVEVTIESPPEGSWRRSPCVFSGSARGQGVLAVRVDGQRAAIENGKWRASLALAEGEHTVEVEVVDSASRSASAARTVRVDTRPPRIEIFDLPRNVRAGGVVVKGKVEDAAAALVTVNGTAAHLQPGGGWEAGVTLVAGKQALHVEAADLAGNKAEPAEKAIVVAPPDTGSPAIAGLKHLGPNGQGYHEYRHEASGLVMVLLPAGSFLMGSPGEEIDAVGRAIDASIGDVKTREFLKHGLRAEGSRREAAVGRFLIAKHEVSQAAWTRVMKTNPSRFKGDDLPVENVTWNDCREFAKRTGLRLPAEAEWEYACRAFTDTPFAFGETVTPEQANYNGNYPLAGGPKGAYRARTVRVAALPANGFSLHNMHGNVSEWCEDLHEAGPSEASPRAAPAANSRAPRVCRGGAWSSFAWACRSGAREGASPDKPHHLRGFRPALSAP